MAFVALLGTIFAGLAALLGAIAVYLAVAKPRIRVYFWTGDERVKTITLAPAMQAILEILLRNEGDNILGHFSPRKPAATRLVTFMYFDARFEIQYAERYEDASRRNSRVLLASPSGEFANMRYVAIPAIFETDLPAISILG